MNPAIAAATAAEIQPVTQRCGNDRLSPYRLMERHSGMPAQQQNNNSASGIFAQNHVSMLPPVIGFGGRPVRALNTLYRFFSGNVASKIGQAMEQAQHEYS
jgi:hypothetical protein